MTDTLSPFVDSTFRTRDAHRLQQLEVLTIDLRAGHDRDPRDAAARPGKTLDEPKANRFLGTRHHDGGLRSYLPHDHGYSVDGHQEHIDVKVSQFGGKRGKPLNSSLS